LPLRSTLVFILGSCKEKTKQCSGKQRPQLWKPRGFPNKEAESLAAETTTIKTTTSAAASFCGPWCFCCSCQGLVVYATKNQTQNQIFAAPFQPLRLSLPLSFPLSLCFPAFFCHFAGSCCYYCYPGFLCGQHLGCVCAWFGLCERVCHQKPSKQLLVTIWAYSRLSRAAQSVCHSRFLRLAFRILTMIYVFKKFYIFRYSKLVLPRNEEKLHDFC